MLFDKLVFSINYHFPSFTISLRTTIDKIVQHAAISLAFIIEPFQLLWLRLVRHLERIDTQRWLDYFTWLYESCIPSINLSDSQKETTWEIGYYVGKSIGIGWAILASLIILAFVWPWIRFRLYTKNALTPVPIDRDYHNDIFTQSAPLIIEPDPPRRKDNSKKHFISSSSARTSTSSSTTTASTSHSTTTNNETEMQTTPPHLVLQKYVHPKRSSFWPLYYIEAFKKAKASKLKMGQAAASHVDAPPSGNTRRSKTEWAGKIVLDKKILERDLRDGKIGLREGVDHLVSYLELSTKS
jgi:hypothetical protein